MSQPSPSRSQDPKAPPLPPDIHLVVDGVDVGPVTDEELLRLAAEGEIGPATLAWHPALDEWIEIGRLPEMAWVVERPTAVETVEPLCVLAGFGVRFAAGGIDMVIWLVLVSLLAVPLGLTSALSGTENDPALAARFNIMAQLAAALYFIVPMSAIGGGATPGYRLFGLRLVEAKSLRAPGVIRTFVWYIVTYVRFVGWVTYFIDSKRRMLHNIISGTLVITVRGAKP